MARPPRCLVEDLGPDVITLGAAARNHLIGALRTRPGALVELVDGRGGLATARLGDQARLEVIERLPPLPPAADGLTLAVAIPRPSRLDWLVEKAVELAVTRLVPLETRHGERTLGAERRARLLRLADEALLQCRRLHRLQIGAPVTLAALLDAATAAVPRPEIWLAAPPPATTAAPHGDAPLPRRSPRRPLLVLIGPEGGFDASELAAAADVGAAHVQFGETVLRVETAALALAVLARAAIPVGDPPTGSLR